MRVFQTRQAASAVQSPSSFFKPITAGKKENEHFFKSIAGNDFALQSKDDDPAVQQVEQPMTEANVEVKYSGHEGDDLRNYLSDLTIKKVTTYVTYKDAIVKASPLEKRVALNTWLLSQLRDLLTPLSFARCVELLGRRSPGFDELRKNSVVAAAIKDAWNASDVGTRDLVTEPHEEGGWIFMNLIDGSLSIVRAKAEGTNFIRVEPPPDVPDSILVAIFHTHPHMGPRAKPGRHDIQHDARRGVPNLVAANTGNNPEVYQIYLSGPSMRKHLASETKIPGRSGGIAP